MRLVERLMARIVNPDIALFHHFRSGPYGGSNQFLVALRDELRRRGFRVSANLVGPGTRAALLNAYAFDVDKLRRMRRSGCRIVHRVDGPVGRYRGQDAEIDRYIAKLNREFATATVFQSQYSANALEDLGLHFTHPVLIPNAVDSNIFHPPVRRPPGPGEKVKLVSTSWSDNPGKGASTYKWIEEHLDWTRFEYTFIGRSKVRFERIRTLAPMPSRPLAEQLRAHDVYVTASQNDPCSNALLEALACGLPALALESGGHPELVGQGGVLFADTSEILGKLDELVATYDEKRTRIRVTSLTDVADRYLSVLLGAVSVGSPSRGTVGGLNPQGRVP